MRRTPHPLLLLPLLLASACGAARVHDAPSVPPAACEGELSDVARRFPARFETSPVGVVSGIEIVGARSVPEALVREAIHSPLGELIDVDAVRADIRRILVLEVFEDVRVVAGGEGDALVLRYLLTQRPLIGRVRVSMRPEAEVPSRLAQLEGEVFVPRRLRRFGERVVTDQRREGYSDASVHVHATRARANRVDVCFEVDLGRRWLIHRFEFVGNERLDDAALSERMATYDGRVNTAAGIYREDFLPDDMLRISALYYDHGMLDVHVAEPRTLWSDADELTVQIPIEEGPVYRLSTVAVRGGATDPEATYRGLLGLRAGQVFSRQRIVQGLERIRAHERERGRGALLISPAVDQDRDAHTVALWIEFGEPETEGAARTSRQQSGEPGAAAVSLPDVEVQLQPPSLGSGEQ